MPPKTNFLNFLGLNLDFMKIKDLLTASALVLVRLELFLFHAIGPLILIPNQISTANFGHLFANIGLVNTLNSLAWGFLVD